MILTGNVTDKKNGEGLKGAYVFVSKKDGSYGSDG